MIKQSEAIFNAIENVLTQANKAIDGQVTLTKEERAEVIEIVTVGLHEGEVSFSDGAKAKYDTFEKIKKQYVPGLLNNWLRKDSRLNGGTKYVPKNPGSRTGSSDEYLKNLKALRQQVATTEDADAMAAVDAEIEKRKAEISKAKVKTIKVNAELLPEELKHLVQE